MFKKILFSMIILSLFNACKTADKDVQQLVHTRQVAASQPETNIYKAKYIANIQGNYKLLDGKTLNIDSSGSFKMEEIEYYIYNAISESQAVYVAVKKDPNSSKKVYTYHGIIVVGDTLLSAPYKTPTFENGKKELTEKETPYAWQVNTFQPENIDWKSGFTTAFANRT